MSIDRVTGSALAALVVAAAVAGCGGSKSQTTSKMLTNTTPAALASVSGGTITIGRSSDISSLDPQELNIGEDYQTQEALYGSLVRPSVDGKSIEGDLASSWTFEEPTLTYTFKLRPHLRFSNGSPITPADIAYSIERVAKGMEYAPMFAAISSITSPVENEIKVKLSRYSNLVLPALSFGFVVPKNLDGQKPTTFFKNPVTSGEFALASWEPNVQMVLKPNPYYSGSGHVSPSEIVFRIFPDETARLNALQAGNIQFDEYVSDEQAPALPGDELLQSSPRADLVELVTNNGSAPFNTKSNREAAALAIDRPLLLKTIWNGAGVPAQGLLPPGLQDSHGTPTGGEAWEYNPSMARALLHGTHPTVILLASYERGVDSRLVDVLQRQLEQAGFHVTVDVRDFASAVTQLLSSKFSLFLTPDDAFLPTVGEPMTTYVTVGAATAHWNAPAAIGYLQKFSLAKTLAQRREEGVQFERWAHSEWLINPLGNPYIYLGVSKQLQGLVVQPFGTYRMGTLQLQK
jgi:peptide/nickel transport system substrate-binding protein